jgi:hypothetical protein
MRPVKFSEKIVVDAAAPIVFDYTQDYNCRLHWDTFLKSADLMNGATAAGKGIKAYCVSRNGLGMETAYVSFNRPKVVAISMTRGPFMFRSFLGSWTFNAINTAQTEVVFLYSFQLRFPFNLAANFLKHHLQREVRQRLVDLKNSVEKIHHLKSAFSV